MVGGKKFVKTRGERPFGRSSGVPAERSRVPRIKIFLTESNQEGNRLCSLRR